jgi:hypothetical protein
MESPLSCSGGSVVGSSSLRRGDRPACPSAATAPGDQAPAAENLAPFLDPVLNGTDQLAFEQSNCLRVFRRAGVLCATVGASMSRYVKHRPESDCIIKGRRDSELLRHFWKQIQSWQAVKTSKFHQTDTAAWTIQLSYILFVCT